MATDDSNRGAQGAPIGRCPACGSERMLAVSNGFETNFLCAGCRRCWSVSLGRASLVDPLSCPGCGHQAECRGRLVDEIAHDEAVGDGDDLGPAEGGFDPTTTVP